MSKADRDRQALLQRLAREQRRALDAAARDADRARTPRTAPTPRRDDSPPSRTSEQPSAQSAARLKSLTPLYKQRQQRRLTVLIVIIIALALALTVVTGTLSASLALLGDAVDSASLYLNRADGGWPATTGITEPLSAFRCHRTNCNTYLNRSIGRIEHAIRQTAATAWGCIL